MDESINQPYLEEVLRVYRTSPQFDYGVLKKAEQELELLREYYWMYQEAQS